MEGKTSIARKLVVLAAFLACTVQSAMTFSRGGLYAMAGGFLAGLFFLLRDSRFRARAVLTAAAVTISALVILPVLNSYTSGALLNRFQDTDTTRRGDLVREDLQMWAEHPIFGVGVGISRLHHDGQLAAHTEFSRLVAEHGVFGIAGVILLVVMTWQRLRTSRSPAEQANTASSVIWSFLTMSAASTRVVATSLMFGVGQVRFTDADRVRVPRTSTRIGESAARGITTDPLRPIRSV